MASSDFILSISNVSYTVDSNNSRKFTHTLNYNNLVSYYIPYGGSIRIITEYYDSNDSLKVRLSETRATSTADQTGSFVFEYMNNNILTDNTMTVKAQFFKLAVDEPMSPQVSGTASLPVSTLTRYKVTFVNGSYLVADLDDTAKNYYISLGNTVTLCPNCTLGSFPAPISTVPNPPILSISGGLLSWTSVNGATAYNLERSINGGLYSSVMGDVTQLSVDVGSFPDATYSYKIRAKNEAGYSSYSNIVTYVIGSTITIPSPPVISSRSSINDPNNNIEVFFTPVPNATHYNLYISSPDYPVFNPTGTITITPINNEIVFPISLSQGYGTYQFKVKASNIYGSSIFSNVVTVTKTSYPDPNLPQTQQVFQISTPNNPNVIRGVFNDVSAEKWIYDNANSLLCNYIEFQGLNVPCSLSYYIIPDIRVSETDNFLSVIEQIRVRYSSNPNPNPIPTDNKNLLSFLPKIFIGLTGLSMLVKK